MDKVQRTLRLHQWLVLGVLVVVALVLGYWGFSQVPGRGSIADRLYLSIQLFPLQSGEVEGDTPLQLGIARFLAPAVAGFATLGALAVLFEDQLRLFGFQRISGHTVIAGDSPEALQLAESFATDDDRVVVVAPAPDQPTRDRLRAADVLVLAGSPVDEHTLGRAKLSRARHFVALLATDSESLAAAEAALAAAGKESALQVFTRVTEPRLRARLSSRFLDPELDSDARMDVFDPIEIAARLALERHSPAEATGLVIAGFGPLGQALLLHAAREQRYAPGGTRLRVTVVAERAAADVERLRVRHPGLDRVCDIDAIDAPFESPEFERGAFIAGEDRRRLVAICARDERSATAATLALDDRVARAVDLVCLPSGEASVRAALHRYGRVRGTDVFGVAERVYTKQLVLHGTRDLLARASHKIYMLAEQRKPDFAAGPSTRPWDELAPTYQKSNRRQADDTRQLLRELGYSVVPVALPEPNGTLADIDPAVIDKHAEQEHERWRSERIADGWRYGPVKDEDAKTHPDLVPWERLPEPEREKNRDAVRNLPGRLEAAGFRMVLRG